MTQRAFDLVLMDVQMPEMDGLDATRAIRAIERETHPHQPRHQPIVAMTALALAGDRERCLAAGMDGYLSKPIRPEELDAILDAWGGAPAASPPVPAVSTAETPVDTVQAEELLARTDNDLELIQELLGMFRESSPRLLLLARNAIQAENAVDLERAAHSLKGSLANLSAVPAATLAGEIEDLARSGTVQCGTHLERLEREIDNVIAALDRICGSLQ